MKKVLFLAPVYKYAETTIRNVCEDLDRHHVGYGACYDRGNMKIRTDNVEVVFVHSDPVTWGPDMFHNCEFVFGKKELVNAAAERFYSRVVRRPNKSLSRFLIEVNREDPTGLIIDDLVPVKTQYIPAIKNAYFNDPMTIVIWEDGTKTIVKCQDGDTYSEEVGLALCISKKALGNKGNFNNVFKKWVPEANKTAGGTFAEYDRDCKSVLDAANEYLDKVFGDMRDKFRGIGK